MIRTGPLGSKVKSGVPESSIMAQLGRILRKIRGPGGVPEEEMADTVPEF